VAFVSLSGMFIDLIIEIPFCFSMPTRAGKQKAPSASLVLGNFVLIATALK
jgi:hypothetical protein